jgi:hypothetical protein
MKSSPQAACLLKPPGALGKALSRRAALLGLGFCTLAAPAAAFDLSEAAPLYVSLIDPYTDETRARGPRRAPPFTASYRHMGRRLVFIASRHDTAPEGETFRTIRRAFRNNPRVVIVEGIPTAWGYNAPRMLAALETARTTGVVDSYLRGEPGYAMELALSQGARFIGGEPSSHAVNIGLYAMGYAREDVAGVKVLQWLPQGQIAGEFDNARDPRFPLYLDRTTLRVGGDFQPQIPYARAAYEAWHERQFGVSVYEDRNLLQRLDPSRAGQAAEISRAMTLLRDRHLFSLIIGTMTEGARTLVIYGGAHYITLHRALGAALGAPRFS